MDFPLRSLGLFCSMLFFLMFSKQSLSSKK